MPYVETGEFDRDTSYIQDRITRDGCDGWPVAPGRYRLVVSRACPWANRAIVVRRLLGLEHVFSMGVCGPVHDERSWTFHLDPGGRDPVLGIERLQEAYFNRFPGYPKGITVPAMVEIDAVQVVTNDFAQLTLDLSLEWRDFHRQGAPDLYPEPRRAEIDDVMAWVYRDVNNGVYRCGFAGSQDGYERAYHRLFAALDRLSDRLERQRYLVGDTITEADVRLFTTLVRFDAAYHGHFKCNRSKLTEMPVLWAYARDLFQTPGFGDTIDSTTSSATTTRSIAISTPRASCRSAPTWPDGSRRTTGSNWAADRSVTARPRRRPPTGKPCRRSTPRSPPPDVAGQPPGRTAVLDDQNSRRHGTDSASRVGTSPVLSRASVVFAA